MYISSINIKKLRNLENVQIDGLKEPKQLSELIVLAGANGSGKSSILDALAYALSLNWDRNYQSNRSFPDDTSFEVAITLTAVEISLIKNYTKSENSAYSDEGIKFFDNNNTYWIQYQSPRNSSFRYAEPKKLVINALKYTYGILPGLYIRSDRAYNDLGFNKELIFDELRIFSDSYLNDIAFTDHTTQMQDLQNFILQQQYLYYNKLGRYLKNKEREPNFSQSVPLDPIEPYNTLLSELIPGYRIADIEAGTPDTLYINLPNNQVIPFNYLSSGEKEVFLLGAAFIRQNIKNSVVLIDEPELHLHPELAVSLVRILQDIKPGNQIWCATHNTDIIDEASKENQFYISYDRETKKSEVVSGENEGEVVKEIKKILGTPAYMRIREKIVFLEGEDNSTDVKLFSKMFAQFKDKVKFIPIKSSDNMLRVNNAVLSLLESSVADMGFYLVRDRDYLTEELCSHYRSKAGNIYVLQRHEIENYLLDEEVIAKILQDVFDQKYTLKQVEDSLKRIARNIAGEVLREMITFRLTFAYKKEDFSVGKILHGETIFTADGEIEQTKIKPLVEKLNQKAKSIKKNVENALSVDSLQEIVAGCRNEIHQAIFGENNGWKTIFPGKRLLEQYVKEKGLGTEIGFKNLIINELYNNTDKMPVEMVEIITSITSEK